MSASPVCGACAISVSVDQPAMSTSTQVGNRFLRNFSLVEHICAAASYNVASQSVPNLLEGAMTRAQLCQAATRSLLLPMCIDTNTHTPVDAQVSMFAQELLGAVADLEWDQTSGKLNLVAACYLPTRTPLTTALTAVGADA